MKVFDANDFMRMIKKKAYVPMNALVLRALIGVGAVSIAILVPNAGVLLKEFDRASVQRRALYNRIHGAAARLERNGLVKISGVRQDRRIVLTEKGKRAAEEAELDAYRIPETALWDGKWRIVIFDMIERRRKVRDRLRIMLKNAGFVRVQDSVWAYPYPCDEFLALVRAHLSSGVGELRSFVAEALESDRLLREHFKLLP